MASYLPFLLLLSAGGLHADNVPMDGDPRILVGEFKDICLAHVNNVEAVQSIAAERTWPTVNPATLPGKDIVVASPRHGKGHKVESSVRGGAWSLTINGKGYIVGLMKEDDASILKHMRKPYVGCEIMTFADIGDAATIPNKIDRSIAKIRGVKKVKSYSNPFAYLWPNSVDYRYFAKPSGAHIFYRHTKVDDRLLHHISIFPKREY